ncbi:Fe-S protein assembly co-chaperone HscB [Paradesertivirga mongoliensis]|uniref:Fe-S protein assembly co-chaperone HscB n=1 Tax=Paradesertivirga mongoliensis TaxID=2100740 RepID=A0ABW4ZQ33_9SPHI|nr:Fe-S protein assembly co-chaperone HscB [Pedobacter mongoliensis]
MNYFEFYDIPEAFHVDEGLVKRKFYELSKTYHPDFYINHSEEKQQEILELSTVNNKAYQVLSNPGKRLEYILQLHGHAIEGEKYQLAQNFLMEMMEINEALMELEFEADPAVIENTEKQISEIESALNTELLNYTSLFDQQSGAEKETLLLKIKDIYYRQKYLLRIRESLNKFASR